MKFYSEEWKTDKAPSDTLVMMEVKDAKEIIAAMEEYVKNHPKKKNAKKLLKEMNEFWPIY